MLAQRVDKLLNERVARGTGNHAFALYSGWQQLRRFADDADRFAVPKRFRDKLPHFVQLRQRSNVLGATRHADRVILHRRGDLRRLVDRHRRAVGALTTPARAR